MNCTVPFFMSGVIHAKHYIWLWERLLWHSESMKLTHILNMFAVITGLSGTTPSADNGYSGPKHSNPKLSIPKPPRRHLSAKIIGSMLEYFVTAVRIHSARPTAYNGQKSSRTDEEVRVRV
jgi:hypothetical protein